MTLKIPSNIRGSIYIVTIICGLLSLILGGLVLFDVVTPDKINEAVGVAMSVFSMLAGALAPSQT